MNQNNTTYTQYLLHTLVSFIVIGTFAGCATTKPADYLAPEFDVQFINDVVVLSVIDHRVDQSKALQLDDWVLPIAEKSLKKKRYAYTVRRDRSLLSKITRDALESPTPEFISMLQPSSAKWILILVLEDSMSKMTFGSSGNAEMSGYLFDKNNKTLAWRDKEIGQLGQGGLIGMAMKGLMERSAIEQAANSVFQAFPARPK